MQLSFFHGTLQLPQIDNKILQVNTLIDLINNFCFDNVPLTAYYILCKTTKGCESSMCNNIKWAV